MIRRTTYGLWVNDDTGTLDENEKSFLYVIACAKSVGMEIVEGETALDYYFISEVMRRMKAENKLADKRCENCKHWRKEKDRDGKDFIVCYKGMGTCETFDDSNFDIMTESDFNCRNYFERG